MTKVLHRLKTSSISVGLFAVTMVVMSGCQTPPPALLSLEPSTYSDDYATIEYRIGTQVYYIRITNESEMDMSIDSQRASIISIRGETRSLQLSAYDTHIPPDASLVFRANVSTFFNTNIDARFVEQEASRSGYDSRYLREEDYLAQFEGETIRLFLPANFEGQGRTYYIYLRIVGVQE